MKNKGGGGKKKNGQETPGLLKLYKIGIRNKEIVSEITANNC